MEMQPKGQAHVENAIEGEREGQSRKRDAQKRHGGIGDFEIHAIGPSWATAISPPAAIMTNMRYMTPGQGGDPPHPWAHIAGVRIEAGREFGFENLLMGLKNEPSTNRMAPWAMPKSRKTWALPKSGEWIML